MDKNEYEKRIEALGINLERLDIVIGSKTNVPFSTGCYYEDGRWVLYNVDERQNLVIIEEGTEKRIFKFLYMVTLGKMKRNIPI